MIFLFNYLKLPQFEAALDVFVVLSLERKASVSQELSGFSKTVWYSWFSVVLDALLSTAFKYVGASNM